MINTKELEKRWYKYKTKSFLFFFTIIAIIGMLVYGGYYILYILDVGYSEDDNETTTQSKSLVVDSDIVEDMNMTKSNLLTVPVATPTPIKQEITKAEEPEEKPVTNSGGDDIVSLSPIIPIVDIDGEKSTKTQKKTTKRRETHRQKHIEKRKDLIRAKESDYITFQELPTVQTVPNVQQEVIITQSKKKIEIKRTSSNYMTIMKEKFQENKNPREALLIAKAYYKAGNYEKSEEWALKANSLDKNLEESWLLFAKSKDALGKKTEALEVLIAYYNRTKSAKVKLLIEKISSKSI
jgi:hypothetical protein